MAQPLSVVQFGFMDWRVVGVGMQDSLPQRSEQEATILMYSIRVMHLMHS
jgi:hypothetical protein